MSAKRYRVSLEYYSRAHNSPPATIPTWDKVEEDWIFVEGASWRGGIDFAQGLIDKLPFHRAEIVGITRFSVAPVEPTAKDKALRTVNNLRSLMSDWEYDNLQTYIAGLPDA